MRPRHARMNKSFCLPHIQASPGPLVRMIFDKSARTARRTRQATRLMINENTRLLLGYIHIDTDKDSLIYG